MTNSVEWLGIVVGACRWLAGVPGLPPWRQRTKTSPGWGTGRRARTREGRNPQPPKTSPSHSSPANNPRTGEIMYDPAQPAAHAPCPILAPFFWRKGGIPRTSTRPVSLCPSFPWSLFPCFCDRRHSHAADTGPKSSSLCCRRTQSARSTAPNPGGTPPPPMLPARRERRQQVRSRKRRSTPHPPLSSRYLGNRRVDVGSGRERPPPPGGVSHPGRREVPRGYPHPPGVPSTGERRFAGQGYPPLPVPRYGIS